MTDSLMTVEEVAKYLKVEESTIYTWAKADLSGFQMCVTAAYKFE